MGAVFVFLVRLLKREDHLVIISNRLSTIRKANKIIVLDKGEIKEIGSHNELLEKRGFYYKLHKMQFEKQEEVV